MEVPCGRLDCEAVGVYYWTCPGDPGCLTAIAAPPDCRTPKSVGSADFVLAVTLLYWSITRTLLSLAALGFWRRRDTS